MASLFEDRPGGGLGLAQDASPLAKFGLTLQAFGAGGLGQEPLLMKLQQQELLERKRKREELESDFKITSEITKQVTELPQEKRDAYLEQIGKQYPKLDKELIRMGSERPDFISSMPAFAQNDPVLKALIAKGDNKGVTDYLKSEVGRKGMNQSALATYVPEFQKKLPQMIDWYKQNNSKEYEKIISDGEITIPELRQIHEGLPEQIKSSKEAFATVTAPENQETLVNMFGDEVKIIPDKTATEQLKPKKAESPIGKLRSDLSKGIITQKDFDQAVQKELRKDPSIARDIVFPIIAKAQKEGIKSLSDNEWAALELAARQTSGIDIELNRITRDILSDKPTGAAEVPKEIMDRFNADKSMKGFKLGMKSEKGYEVLDKDGNLVGFYGKK